MKKYAVVIAILLTIAAIMYSFVYFFVLPKTAQALIPVRMERNFLGKRRDIVEDYLGNVSRSKTDTDVWKRRVNNFTYSLTIQYNSQDSTAEKYLLKYAFKNNLFQREQVIYSDSTN